METYLQFRYNLYLPLFAAILLLFCGFYANANDEVAELVEQKSSGDETVVLLHGIGRGRASLWLLDTRLQQAGYKTLNYPCAAQSESLEDIAKQLCVFISEKVKTQKYHLIAHSLGNLVIRIAFKHGYPDGLEKIVMLAPPNRPTELARALRDNPIYKWFTNDEGWLLASDDFYSQLPVPNVPFGIIAGNRGQAFMLTEPNDGVITVESTKLEGMSDWIVVPQAHTFIMNSRIVAELCVSFIKQGKFDHHINEGEPQIDDVESSVSEILPGE